MGKKRKGEPSKVGPSTTELSHNPFGALADRRTELPASEPRVVAGSSPERITAPDAFSRQIVVRREKKGRGGKSVTRIQGLPAHRRTELVQRMKKALGCGATVDGEDVLLHGALVERAVAWLQELGADRVVAGN